MDRCIGPDRQDVDVEVHRLPPAMAVSLPTARRIGIRDLVDQYCPMDRCPGVSHGECIELQVLQLVQSPKRSPLYKLQEWAEEHSAELIYGQPADGFNDDRVGRALEAISDSIVDIETAVAAQAITVYKIDTQVIHWDLTHVTFSGADDAIEAIGAGYGGGRLNERQVKLSLHATNDGGIPIRHEVIPGPKHQAPYAPGMLADLQQRLGRSDLLIISDRAGISYDNLVAYRKGKAHCIGPLQETAAERERLAAAPLSEFQELSYRASSAKDGVYRALDTTLVMTRQKHCPPLKVRALFVHSTRREADDAAAREKQLAKTLDALRKVRSRLNKNRYAKRDYAREQVAKKIPKGLQESVRAEVTGEDKAVELNWTIDEAALADKARYDGRYIVIADVDESLSPDRIFQLFKEQNVIEQRFRALKNDLIVPPIWLHKENRIRGLLLVFVLALIVYTIMERCSVRAKLTTKYYHKMTARELIYAFQWVDLIEVRIRGRPTQWKLDLSDQQRRLLQRLRMPTPNTYLNLR